MATLSELPCCKSECHKEKIETYIQACINDPQYMRYHIHDIKKRLHELIAVRNIIERNNNNDTPQGIGHSQ